MIPIAAANAWLAARSFLKRVPRKVWVALAVAAVAAIIFFASVHAHSNAVKRVYADGYDHGVADTKADFAAAQAVADARAARINSNIRKQTDETNRRIAADADALRLLGPGKATCPGLAAAPGAARGHVNPAGAADGPVDQLPSPARDDIIALPFAGTVAFAEQHDRCLAEARAWRESDRQQRALTAQPQE